jgi:hypothetical protein
MLKRFILALTFIVAAAAGARAADTVSSTTIRNTNGNYAFLFGNASDGTGESAVVKVTAAELSGTPTKFMITKLKWATIGMAVSVLFDASTDDRVAILTGTGSLDELSNGPLKDPQSSGHTGNVLFTTHLSTSTVKGSYTIYMELKKVL